MVAAPKLHLAQANVARLRWPEGDPRVQPFFDDLDRINRAADDHAGFVWRLETDSGNATSIKPTVDPLFIFNLSLWQSVEALFDFVYRSAHTPVMAKRRDWFDRFDGQHQALWWLPAGQLPTVDQALARLWHLEHYGPSAHAFTFKARFAAPADLRPTVLSAAERVA